MTTGLPPYIRLWAFSGIDHKQGSGCGKRQILLGAP